MSDEIKIWCDARLTPEAKAMLRAGVENYPLNFADELHPEARHTLVAVLAPLPEDAVIAFGQPSPDEVRRSPRLRWVHLNSAGYTSFDHADILDELRARGCILTTSSDVYAEPCALHLLAMMTSLARRLPAAHDNQRGAQGWPFHANRAASYLLEGQRALLLGFGSIARRFAELVAPLRMDLVAVRRRVQGDEPIQTFPASEIARLLPTADHVVNILPASAATERFLDAERLALIKRGAILYNIGRGTTLDQEALAAALISGHLAAAFLDVTDPEPLPPGHALWALPNCYITPHTAGGHRGEAERLTGHFLVNFRRFLRGETLLNRIA